jgi:hypothetical protein
LEIERKLKEIETKRLRGIRDKKCKRLEKALYDRVSDAHGKLGELLTLVERRS